MVLTISRAATVYSLVQLEAEQAQVVPQLPDDASLAAAPQPPKGFLSAPECAVRDVAGSLLPLYRFPSRDGFLSAGKRVRSFGDLLSSAVPDMDGPRPRRSPSASGLSSDDEAAVPGSGGESMSTDDMTAPYHTLDSSSPGGQVVPQRSMMDVLLLAEWEDRAEAGLFRYDVTACPTRMLPGAYGFVAQCNEGRASKKRPTEFRVDQVAQPFDDSKFNFSKALQKEVLFQFEPSRERKPSFSAAAAAPPSPHLVFINVSPIEYGHVLLVPRVADRLPQLVSPDTLLLALQFAREADNPFFRLCFNSLGAYGTINHLHFQGYYLAAPFPIERAPTAPLAKGLMGGGRSRLRGVSVQQVLEYPVRSLVFEAGDSLEELARVVGEACQRLTKHNVPHNLFICDSGARVFLYPNLFAERKARGEIPADILDTQVDPAGWEIAGHIVLKRAQDYEAATQEAAWRLLALASCCEERFRQVAALALGEELAPGVALAGC